MFPNDPQNQPGNPASLPAVPMAEQPQPPVPVPPAKASQAGVDDITAHAAAQAKQLVLQYSNDPYKLSEALSQLKTAYLADQYHITASQAEN